MGILKESNYMTQDQLAKDIASKIEEDETISINEAWGIAEDLADREITSVEWRSIVAQVNRELNFLNK